MFKETYPVSKVTVSSALSSDYHLRTTIYRFDARDDERYLIYLKEYPEKFHTVDFCRNKAKNSRHRFTELTSKRDAIRILSTVVGLMIRLLVAGRADAVCFGFIGARMREENDEASSKRFRVYRQIMLNLIDANEFHHLEAPKRDAYLIINRKANAQKVVAVAKKAFEKDEEE
ncbi:hypothetical protein [Neolewinella persica]|uniref:hypothetical protein n=1 Tax=Neolewinella persica TaxID=70998 RepID=UPI00037CF8A7|nr:hypothetical protein [Neolewinella persica]